MYSGKLVFAQVMDHLPMHTFRQAVTPTRTWDWISTTRCLPWTLRPSICVCPCFRGPAPFWSTKVAVKLHTLLHSRCSTFARPDLARFRPVGMAHTNGLESLWSLMKRGYHGNYHKMSRKHLARYVGEFSGRHNDRPAGTHEQNAPHGPRHGRATAQVPTLSLNGP